MRVSIGILAYNEEFSIGTTIRSLFEQSLLQGEVDGVDAVEVVCVPNGCTDSTARVAEETFESLRDETRSSVTTRVCDLEQGGKMNAWNEFVHRLSDPAADYLLLLDGDIRLLDRAGCGALISALRDDPHLLISGGIPIKHVAFKKRKTLRDRISLSMSGMRREGIRAKIAGCYYCARSSDLRRLVFPAGTVAEDEFLVVCACSNYFTEPYDPKRVVNPPEATAVFQAYTSFGEVYHNLKRRAVTRFVNYVLLGFLDGARREGTMGADAGEILHHMERQDPDWFRKRLDEHVANSGWWVMPPRVLSGRYYVWSQQSSWSKVKRFPIMVGSSLLDFVVYWNANRAVKSGSLNLWRTTRTTELSSG